MISFDFFLQNWRRKKSSSGATHYYHHYRDNSITINAIINMGIRSIYSAYSFSILKLLEVFLDVRSRHRLYFVFYAEFLL